MVWLFLDLSCKRYSARINCVHGWVCVYACMCVEWVVFDSCFFTVVIHAIFTIPSSSSCLYTCTQVFFLLLSFYFSTSFWHSNRTETRFRHFDFCSFRHWSNCNWEKKMGCCIVAQAKTHTQTMQFSRSELSQKFFGLDSRVLKNRNPLLLCSLILYTLL